MGMTVLNYRRNRLDTDLAELVLDSMIPSMIIGQIIWNLILDVNPPHMPQALVDAFAANEAEQYFKTFSGILEYTTRLESCKIMGFFAVVLLTVRLILYLQLHP